VKFVWFIIVLELHCGVTRFITAYVRSFYFIYERNNLMRILTLIALFRIVSYVSHHISSRRACHISVTAVAAETHFCCYKLS